MENTSHIIVADYATIKQLIFEVIRNELTGFSLAEVLGGFKSPYYTVQRFAISFVSAYPSFGSFENCIQSSSQ